MKALTICQPYAHLIMLPAADPHSKRVENRVWPTQYCGPLLIHAGKSKNWLELNDSGMRDVGYDLPLADMAFGAIVGIAELQFCLTVQNIQQNAASDPAKWALDWKALAISPHTNGPWCFVLHSVRRFPAPIPYKGAQGLFNIPENIVAEQLARAVAV